MTIGELKHLHITIEGRVQGVGFRYFVLKNAQQLGITGWVRNRWNGTVEIRAEGKIEDLEKFLHKVKRGPQSAFVLNTIIQWHPYQGKYKRFSIKPTD